MKFSVFSKNKILSDTELLAKYRNTKNLELLGELYYRYFELVLGLSYKYFKNKEQSEDAVMEIFELLIKRIENHEVQNFKAWLYRLASNYCLDQLRKEKRAEKHRKNIVNMYSQQDSRHSIKDFDALDEKELNLQLLEHCLESLKENQRVTVRLFFLELKSYKEVAEQLQIDWNKTRSLIQNGKRNLKKCMEQNATL